MTLTAEETPSASQLVAKYAANVKGKTILTTGVTPDSIGAAYVEAVAEGAPALLILAGRSQDKLDKEKAIINKAHPDVAVKTVIIDLLSLASVREAAATINGWKDVPAIDVVCNSAAIMAWPHTLTVDGFESQFATNHLAHFLLVNLLVPKLLASPGGKPRVVSVSSSGHRFSPIRWGDINFKGNFYNSWTSYGQSKTANMLFALGLADRLGSKGLYAFSVHPGLIFSSGLANHLDVAKTWGTNEGDAGKLIEAGELIGTKDPQMYGFTAGQGAAGYAEASFSPALETKEKNGSYLDSVTIPDPLDPALVRPWGTSRTEAELLWRLSEEMVGQKFEY